MAASVLLSHLQLPCLVSFLLWMGVRTLEYLHSGPAFYSASFELRLSNCHLAFVLLGVEGLLFLPCSPSQKTKTSQSANWFWVYDVPQLLSSWLRNLQTILPLVFIKTCFSNKEKVIISHCFILRRQRHPNNFFSRHSLYYRLKVCAWNFNCWPEEMAQWVSVLALKGTGCECKSPALKEKPGMDQNWRMETRRSWPGDSAMLLRALGSGREPALKSKVKDMRWRHVASSSGLQMC